MIKKIIILYFIVCLFPAFVLAQDDAESPDPFVQSDFRVLLGDVLRPNGIFYYEGYLFTGCAGDWTVYRIDAETGDTETYIFGVKNIHDLYVEALGEQTVIWAADFQENRLVRMTREKGAETVYENLAAPWGLEPSPFDDRFYISQWQSDDIIRVNRTGDDIDVILQGLDDPSGMIVNSDALYIANNGNARRAVEWVELDEEGNALSDEPQALISGLSDVTNLVMGPDDKLYMAYALGTRGVVGRVDPAVCKSSGGCTNVDVELVVWTELSAPLAGLVVTPDMRLYVHTMFGSEIYWLDLLPQE